MTTIPKHVSLLIFTISVLSDVGFSVLLVNNKINLFLLVDGSSWDDLRTASTREKEPHQDVRCEMPTPTPLGPSKSFSGSQGIDLPRPDPNLGRSD